MRVSYLYICGDASEIELYAAGKEAAHWGKRPHQSTAALNGKQRAETERKQG
jgi:hypothetical protein